MTPTLEKIAAGIWRLSAGTPENFTPVRLRRIPPKFEALPPEAELPFEAAEIRFAATARGVTVELPAVPEEDFYGLGLQLKSFRQTNKKKVLRVNSDPVADLGDSHAPVPFYLSTAGYGVLVDTARYAAFYLGSHRSRREEPSPAGQGDRRVAVTTEELYAARREAPKPSTVEIPHAAGIDLYLFAGPSLRDALKRYVMFSGGGVLPPLWGLGLCYRGYGPNDAEATLKLARELRAEKMPCDIFGLEPGWQSHAYPCTYVWDPGRFPEPEKTLGELKALGYEVNLWEHPFVHPDSPVAGALEPYAGDYRTFDGLVPDFSLPEARSVYAGYHCEHLLKAGVSGLKIDECDGSDFISFPWSFPEFSSFPSGMDGEQMHSLFGFLCMQTAEEAFAAAGIATWSNIRNAQALAAPYPYVLYSDLYDQKDFTRGLVNAGFSGLLWTPEVRQCDSVADLARRLALVIFSPMALVNAWMIKHPPWLQYDCELNNQDRLRRDAARVTALCRELCNIRMSLGPYLYAAFAAYRETGLPPFRALVVDYPDDPGCRDVDDEILVGDSLLFAPLQAPAVNRRVYLPPGRWRHWRSGKSCKGGRSHRVAVDLGDLALFVREGAVLPWAEPRERLGSGEAFVLTAKTYGRPAGPARLYDGGWLELSIEPGSGRSRLSRPSSLYRV